MAIKTQADIEKELITSVLAETDKVTYFGRGSVTRAILRAISGVVAEARNDVTQFKRNAFLDLATADNLDILGERRGVLRRSAGKSSAIVVFTGTLDTVIPSGTQIRSSVTNKIFTTKADVIIGSKNPDYQGLATDISLADSAIAESADVGLAGKTPANSLTQLVSPISGVSVTNPSPSVGWEESESDALYRQRIRNQVSLLFQGTQLFFETLAMQANSDVVRAIAQRRSGSAETIYVAKQSGGLFTDSELDAMQAYIASYQRAMHTPTCLNLVFTRIIVVANVRLETGVTLQSIHTRISDNLAAYLDWRTWNNADPVSAEAIKTIITDDPDVYSLDPSSFEIIWTTDDVTYTPIQGNLTLQSNSLPRFAGLTLNDTAQTDSISSTAIQQYLTAPS